MTTVQRAHRDAGLATLLLLVSVWVGSRGGRDLDAALFGYLGAVVVATYAIAHRASAFWRRPQSAFYANAAWNALRDPRRWPLLAKRATADLVTQKFIARRSRLRWLAHMALSLGTLASFAVTLPLVLGWLHFEVDTVGHYRPTLMGLALPGFAVDSWMAWVTFHALMLCAVAVTFGAAVLLMMRLRARSVPGTWTAAHVAPLVLLLAVALTGMALPATRSLPRLFDVAVWLHELTVIALLVSLAASKLSHVLIRPLQLGVRVVRAADAPARACVSCGDALAPAAQLAAVEALLAARGARFAGHQRICPTCRRQSLAVAQADLIAAGFHAEARRRTYDPQGSVTENMAHLHTNEATIINEFGPHLEREPFGGFAARGTPDRLVKTHCCFCGQQCGVQLAVKDERVVGIEPWEDFPFNRGKLCPKGIKRYLQNNHRDRLLEPLERTDSGFAPLGWDEALTRVAERIRAIQAKHGRDSVAVISGASLTNEKAYLMGKFARLAVGTRHIDYNGRLCMVAAGAANKKAFGIDRAANPWSDIETTDLVMVLGSNISECSPITTDYIWRARDRGARLIVVDPRLTPIARTADLYLPVRPGRDLALMNAILREVMRLGGLDLRFIAEHTSNFDAVVASVRDYSAEKVEREVGIPAHRIREAAQMWVQAPRTMLLHARGIEHHTKGVDNVLSCINLVLATGKIGRRGCGYASITGQGNGQGGREHGQRCTQLPGARDIDNPADRAAVAEVWGVPEHVIPHSGATTPEIFEKIHRGEIRGLITICINPAVSLPDAAYTREALERLDFYTNIDFFLSETARHADIVLPGSLQEEDEGTVTSTEGRVIHIRQAVSPPAGARRDWEIICDLAKRLDAVGHFDFQHPREIFDELRRASRGGIADYSGITWEKIDQQMGVFWPCPDEDHPGTPRLFEGGRFYHRDGKARFHPVHHRPPAEDVDAEYPVILTTGRVVSQFLSGNQTRRIGPLVDAYPEPRVEIHPKLAGQLGIADGEHVRVVSRRGDLVLPAQVVATIRPDTVFIPYHWPGKQSANRLTVRAYDPVAGIPEYKVAAVRLEKLSTQEKVA